MTKNNLINDKKLLLTLTFPIFLELMLQMLMGSIDQMMLSKYSPLAVAAVGNANQILNFLIIAFEVLCTASMILITQYIGAKENQQVDKIYSLAFIMNIVISFLIGIIIFFFSDTFYGWMQVQSDILPQARNYIILTGCFLFLQAASLTLATFLRSNHYMYQSMIASVIMNVINIFGNLILINGLGPIPALGASGAAISTSVSRFIGVIIMIALFKKYVGNKIKLKHLKPFPKDIFKKLLFIGLPSAGESFAYSFSQIVIMGFINLMGTLTVNAKIYSSMLVLITYIFTMSISRAAQVLLGNMLGAKEYDSSQKLVKETIITSMLITLIISLVLFFGAGPIVGIFTKDQEIIKICRIVLFIDIFLEQGRALNICFVRFLQTSGDIKFPTILGISSTWIVAVALSYVFGIAMNMGLAGIWLAMTLDEILRGIIFIFRWRTGVWKRIDLVR